MSVQQAVIVDTNILFSCLLSGPSSFGETLLASDDQFFVGEQVIVELFKHKEKLVRLSRLSEDEILQYIKYCLNISVYKRKI